MGKGAGPFDPAFAAAVGELVAKAASTYRHDPYLIGYFVDNELAWGLGNAADPRLRYGLALETLRLGATSPAKLAFVAQPTEKYRDAEHLAARNQHDAVVDDALHRQRCVLRDAPPSRRRLRRFLRTGGAPQHEGSRRSH